jgi:Protein of unknown function (DUF3306)
VTERENIIRRWVRLKRSSKVVGKAYAAPDGAVATATRTEGETERDTLFDLASLPSIESIVADTDIGAFLRSEVPAELTRAALRRAWTSDPAIRDFIGIAENQWDFNDPDAIPGFGPLTTMEASANALAQIFSGRLEEVRTEAAPPGDSTSSRATCPASPIADVRLADSIDKGNSSNEMPAADPEQGQDRQIEDYHVPGKLRRHGGALPR